MRASRAASRALKAAKSIDPAGLAAMLMALELTSVMIPKTNYRGASDGEKLFSDERRKGERLMPLHPPHIVAV